MCRQSDQCSAFRYGQLQRRLGNLALILRSRAEVLITRIDHEFLTGIVLHLNAP